MLTQYLNSFLKISFYPRFLCCLFLSIILAGTTHAATTTVEDIQRDFYGTGGDTPKSAVRCFDYYNFGSVQVDASPITLTNIIPGKPITFQGKIFNSNAYPVVNGQVYVKIFKKDQPNESLLRINGYPIVDFFLAKDTISIAGNAVQDIAFDWQVPESARGEYQAVFFFTSAYRYNLLGLSFTDDVVGGKANFSIISTSTPDTSVTFDKNSLMLNNNAYHPVTILQHFTKDDDVTVSATLKNPSSKEKTVEVTWTTSKWDGILPSNEVKEETVSVTLKPKETKKISYTPPIVPTSVTYIQGKVKDADAKSIIQIRFVRDGIEDIRTNFPGIMTYPLVGGQEATIFSCLHATNQSIIDGGKLTLTLKDESGAVLHTYTYTGGITGEMMGVKDSFIPKKNLSTFSLTAKLERAGSVLEEVVLKYSCGDINQNLCPAQTTESPSGPPNNGNSRTLQLLIGALVGLLVIGGGAFFVIKKRRSVASQPETTTTSQ
jgi:hypothetical protein